MPKELSLVYNFRKFLKNNWFNGICVMVADKAEYSDPKDTNIIPRNTPLELFDEEVPFAFIKIFLTKFFRVLKP